MVKRHCHCKYQASTPDLVKISSPKARDDPFGSSARSVASTISDPVPEASMIANDRLVFRENRLDPPRRHIPLRLLL
ncbi:unnamed protein product [Arabis nemorensis]|uniref:Uncharacterized protein n=1 Tax=Arabis nemorensis TaxID=586526 RepID=A0A565CLZ8_9BRAS|nr:unnamed protein product [Arabis nemorensis]